MFTSRKSGPNYHFYYDKNDCDIFAIYCVDDNKIAWFKSTELTVDKSCINLRVDAPKNNQGNVNMLSDYLDVMRILRDYTQDILPDNAEDNDIVQTTTTMLAEEISE